MVHLMKLCVGVHEIADLAAWQVDLLARQGSVFHLTRNFPRRVEELCAGGSLYWVIGGAMVVRQAILGIDHDQYDDGSACACIRLDPALVTVAGRWVRAFQGWRYLEAEAAPPDLMRAGPAQGEEALPEPLRRALRELALL